MGKAKLPYLVLQNSVRGSEYRPERRRWVRFRRWLRKRLLGWFNEV